MTADTLPPSLEEVRAVLAEDIARIIEPDLAAMLDRGHLNQWGYECWGKTLSKAYEIAALYARQQPPAEKEGR